MTELRLFVFLLMGIKGHWLVCAMGHATHYLSTLADPKSSPSLKRDPNVCKKQLRLRDPYFKIFLRHQKMEEKKKKYH